MKLVRALGVVLAVLELGHPAQGGQTLQLNRENGGLHPGRGLRSPGDAVPDRADRELVNAAVRFAHASSFAREVAVHPDWMAALEPIADQYSHWFAAHYTCLWHHLVQWEHVHHHGAAEGALVATWTEPAPGIESATAVPAPGERVLTTPPAAFTAGAGVLPDRVQFNPQDLPLTDSPLTPAPEPSGLFLVISALAEGALVSLVQRRWRRPGT
jgi:hypothetical protein